MCNAYLFRLYRSAKHLFSLHTLNTSCKFAPVNYKFLKMNSIKRPLLFIFCLLFPILTYALSGKEHARDMQRIFPFVKCECNNKVIDFYSLVNQYIDRPNDINIGKPNPISNHPKFSQMKFGNHRIWYHWGFNTNPKKFTPLVDAVNRSIADSVISENDVEEFWDCVMADVSRRNRYLMNCAADIFGYKALGSISTNQRRQLNAFVTVLYSIHILGDHQCLITDVMCDIKRVYADIFNAIDDLAGKDKANVLQARDLKKVLRPEQDDPKVFLDKMEEVFSPFLLGLEGSLYNYKEKFESLGYKLKI